MKTIQFIIALLTLGVYCLPVLGSSPGQGGQSSGVGPTSCYAFTPELLHRSVLKIKSVDPTSYHAFTGSNKTNYFYDDFSDNSNDWYTGYTAGDQQGKIENGYYYYQSLKDRSKISFITFDDFSEYRDYEIEVRLKVSQGNETGGSALLWGYKNGDNNYGFFISPSKKFYIRKKENGTFDKYKPWEYHSGLNGYDYNKLTVRKYKGTWYFFINEMFVYSTTSKTFLGNRIGLQVSSNSTLHIDYLRLSYLDVHASNVQSSSSGSSAYSASNTGPTISITEPSLQRAFQGVNMGMKTLEKDVRIAGKVTDPDGIYEVTVNGREAILGVNGTFSSFVPLAMGNNDIKIVATDVKQKSTTKEITIYRGSDQTLSGVQKPEPERVIPVTTVPSNEKRLALIIGNSNYINGGSLANPVNDARSIKAKLEQLGFRVIMKENANQGDMKRAIDQFGNELKAYDVGLFFYAGHGVQVKGANYLVPINANLSSANDVEYDCVDAGRVLAKMEDAGSKTNIVILDACRNNPFERSWSRSAQGKGLAFMNAPAGSLIAYATSPGNTASDGSGANGLYTSALLKHIDSPGLSILEMFQKVRSSVMSESGNAQTPWESTSLRGNFYFQK